MKKHMVVGIAMAMGILTMGAVSASAADICGKCTDNQSVQQFTQETAALSGTLQAKDNELREQYASDSIDIRKVNSLESEIKALKHQINAAAHRLDIHTCSHS